MRKPPDATLTTAVVCSWVATALAGIYLIGRLGFESHLDVTLKTLGASYFFLFCPIACGRVLTARAPAAQAAAGALLAALGVAVAAGWILTPLGQAPSAVVPALGIALAVYAWSLFVSRVRFGSVVGYALGALLFALWSSGSYYYGRDILFLERLVVTGDTAIDALYHAANSSILKTYDAVSTGLDGLVFNPYHFGSHWIFAQLSKLLGIPVMLFYLVGFQVVFVPLLLYALVIFALALKAQRLEPNSDEPSGATVGLWATVAVATVGFAYLDSISVSRNETIVQSESFCVSFTLLFLAGTLMLGQYRRLVLRRAPMRPADYWLLWVLLPALMGLVGLAKVSTMALAVLALAYLVWRLGLYRVRAFVIGLMITLILALAVTAIFAEQTQQLTFAPFHYVTRYVMPDAFWQPQVKVLLYVVFRFFWLWVLVAFLLSHGLRIGGVSGLREAFRKRATLPVEVALILSVAGVIPGLLWAIPGGGAGYFQTVQNYVALAFVLGRGSRIEPGRGVWRRGRLASGLASAALVLGVLALLGPQALKPFRAFALQHLAVRDRIMAIEDPEVVPVPDSAALVRSAWASGDRAGALALLAGVFRPEGVESQLRKYPMSVVEALRELDRLPLSEKRVSVLFIPRTNRLYWGGLRRNHLADNVPRAAYAERIYGGTGLKLPCDTVPFLAPALSGMAMLDGLPERPCGARAYGYPVYYETKAGRPLVSADSETRRQRAARAGFLQVITLDEVDGAIQVRKTATSSAGPAAHSASVPLESLR